MGNSGIKSGRSLAQNAFAAFAASVAGWTGASNAVAAGTPVFTPGQAGTFTQNAGTPQAGGSPYHVALPFTANTPQLMTNQIAFGNESGYTIGTAGIANSQSSTTTRVIIGSGTGISQTDPNNAESASSLEVFFNAEWTVPASGFGAPVAGNFTLPIGANVGAFGSAGVSVTMDWDYIRGSSEFALNHFAASKSFPGTSVTQRILSSITAPTVLFSPNQFIAGDILVLTGDIIFTANADDPTLIEIPTVADFRDLGVNADQVGSFSADVVPEPASLTMLSAGASGLLLRRRRRHVPA